MRRLSIIFALSFALILLAAKIYYDTNTIEVKHYQIKESALGEALAGLKVAFLTDLHIRKIDVRENKILQILHEEKPDLILLSGDYISFEGPYEPVMSFFHQFKAPYGVYGVLGNTEYSNENGSCILCHNGNSRSLKENPNPIFLRNSAPVFEANRKKINIIGVDDPVNKKSDFKTTLKKANLSRPSILLAHSPEIFEEASGYGIDLILCGHNHGGQILITEYLRYLFPLDPALEFLEGFFQKGKTLMYVSRGIGTSYLPFRLGVKPEITFFEFTDSTNKKTNNTNEKIRIARMNPAAQSSVLSPDDSNSLPPTSNLKPLTKVDPSNPVISNNPPRTVFAGLTLSNLIEMFNVLRVLDSLGLTAAPQHRSTSAQQVSSTATRQHSSTAAQEILFDFESDEDLKRLNWECHKWFELSGEHATSGKHSLKVWLPPGRYPGIYFEKIWKSWSNARYFGMDVFNPSEERVTFHIRIDDNKSGWEYADRFDINFELKQGLNHISIPTHSIRTNIHHRPLNLKRIERMMVFIPNNSKRRELYIDNIRLE
jgi:predicted MPP superfamily phosphohydrolase